MSNWIELKKKGIEFYSAEYWAWQSTNAEFGGKIQAEFLFQKYVNEYDNVLDFGCGSGTTIKNIRCNDKYGIEINPYAREYALKNGVKVFEKIEELEDNFFDVIISNHALEHSPNPFEILKNLYKKLKDNGRFVIYVPSMEDELGKIKNMNNSFDENDRDFHLFGWNYQLLSNLFLYAGYKIEDCKTVKYSRTGASDDAFRTGGIEKFRIVAEEENVHPQTFVLARK